ncbi:MAG: hypothetical protein AAFV07_00440 [Bacteroidota bacterium]
MKARNQCIMWLVMIGVYGIKACRTPGIEDIAAPTVAILSPAAFAVFQSQDSIPYHIQLADNDLLHDVHLIVREADTGFLRLSEIAHPHADTMTFSGTFALETKEPLDFTLRVEASDHHENLVEQEITFSVHP